MEEKKTRSIKIIAENRKAYHDYFIEDTLEAGLVLAGTEVKSSRLGKLNLKDSYVQIREGEAFIVGMHISPYEQGNIFNKDPLRDKKLLMHKVEIMRLLGYVKQKGLSLIPIKAYLHRGRVKLEIGIARGKKLFDKRDDIASRDAQREIERHMKSSNREE
jgi:SsrA-binding protein